MKYKVKGITRPQYTRIGLIKPGEVIEVNASDLQEKARRIRYLKPIKEKKEEEKCQKKEKQSQRTRKPLSGGQKLRLTSQKKNC